MPVAATSAQAAKDLLALNEGQVGVSTGYMERLRGKWPQLIDEAKAFSADVVELSALSGPELPALTRVLSEDLHDFGTISVHGPAKDWGDGPHALAELLASAIPSYVVGIVMHPETLQEPEPFALLGDRLFLENMDARKDDARTVEELTRYFAVLPDASFCFDIAHAYLNDHSMRLAHRLLDAYGDRLREVHISSILDDGTHVPLRANDVVSFLPVLERCVGVPWILEAAPPPSQPSA